MFTSKSFLFLNKIPISTMAIIFTDSSYFVLFCFSQSIFATLECTTYQSTLPCETRRVGLQVEVRVGAGRLQFQVAGAENEQRQCD